MTESSKTIPLSDHSALHRAPGPHIPLRYRFMRLFFAFAGWLLFRIRIVGSENIPHGNYIALANHLNWVDPLLLMIALPPEPRLYFIGAAQAKNRGWKTFLFDRYDGWIPFERGARWVGKDIFERPLAVLQSAAVLALFPEGDVGPREGELQPLRPGIGHLVARAPFPILPLALSGTKELYWRKEITITIGKPFRVAIDGLAHHAAVTAATEQVESTLRALIPPYSEPKPAHKYMLWLTDLLDR